VLSASDFKALAGFWRDTRDSGAALRRDSAVALLAFGGILCHLCFRLVIHSTAAVSRIPLYVVLAAGGLPLVVVLIRECLAREFGSDLLAGISIVVAFVQGKYLVGSIIVLMLSGGATLEEYSSRRASFVLDALAKRMPQSAHRKVGEEITDVKLEAIHVRDSLIIYPHEVCPTDGVVLEGQGTMNEAFLTGERNLIPVKLHPSTSFSKVPSASIPRDTKPNFDASAMAEKVVT
jgi:cation transport ATPase